MNRTLLYRMTCVLAYCWLSLACSGESGQTPEEQPATAAATEEKSPPDPGPEEAKQVEDFVRAWVAERAGEGSVYNIPPRVGQDVAGALDAFHTVHQKDTDTYSVCVDFRDGENTYDVDFLVSRGESGLSVSEHFLHKVNGETLE